MIITDKNKIDSARQYVLGHNSYITLDEVDFRNLAPGPDCLIHVVGNDAQETADRLKAEFDTMTTPVGGFVTFVKSKVITMNELSKIVECFPGEKGYKGGLCFEKPEGGSVEVMLFLRLG